MSEQKQNERGWDRVHFQHSSGQSDCGLELYAHLGRPLTENDKRVIYKAMEDLHRQLLAESARLHPDNIEWKKRWLVRAAGLSAVPTASGC